MSTRIRVFVSSTMDDLESERDAVVRRIAEFNFEPVNAEGWLPDGSSSWERIERELRSSHLLVLISGKRYGWIPEEGPGSGRDLSVTHLEADYARNLGIPIIPFLKRLKYGSPSDSEDAKRRDSFRKEIMKWSKGLFVTEFDLASDLAQKVGAALVGVLSETYLKSALADRAKEVSEPSESEAPHLIRLSTNVVDFIRSERPLLLAGAGMSLSAGFPSAQALVELLHQEISRRGLDSRDSMVAGSFQDLADGFVALFGRTALEEIVARALTMPPGVRPTTAHLGAVRHFKRIVTTNFDTLFEQAALEQEIPFRVVVEDSQIEAEIGELTIIKLDGSISDPGSLVMTASDAFDLRHRKEKLFRLVERILASEPLVVVGHSMRDANIKQIMNSRDGSRGVYVAPDLGRFETLRIERFGFMLVDAFATDFFEALERDL